MGRARRLRKVAGGVIVAATLLGAAGSATAAPVSSAPVQVDGILGAVHADPTDGRSPAYLETMVTSERDRSQSTEITFPPALINRYGGIDAFQSKRVSVTAVARPGAGTGGA
jgi:hypothetical protein